MADNSPIDRLWTVRDVCAFLQVGRNAVYDMAARGDLPSIRVGTRVRFDPAKVRTWVERQGSPGAAVLAMTRSGD